MKKYILFSVMVATATCAFSQDVFAPVLGEIERNSLAIRGLEQELRANELENRTGISLPDPEVEMGFLWGSPSPIGNRKDISVSQELDFPTAYIEKRRLSKLKDNSSNYEFQTGRIELLLEAKTILIELVYCNAMLEISGQRLDNAKRIAAAYEKMLEAGQTDRLEYNKAVLNLADVTNSHSLLQSRHETLLSQLKALNGGQNVEFDCAAYPAAVVPGDFESWYAQVQVFNPTLRSVQSRLEETRSEARLSVSESLPALSLGYMGEFVPEEHYQGITFGMSIPVFENRGRIRQARAQVLASEIQARDAGLRDYESMKSLYCEVIGLQENVERSACALEQNDNVELLQKAFESREITLLEYLMELDYCYSAFEKSLEAQRDLNLALARLTANSL